MNVTVTITLETPDRYTAEDACRDFDRKQEAVRRAIPGCRGSDVNALFDTAGILEAIKKAIIAHQGEKHGNQVCL